MLYWCIYRKPVAVIFDHILKSSECNNARLYQPNHCKKGCKLLYYRFVATLRSRKSAELGTPNRKDVSAFKTLDIHTWMKKNRLPIHPKIRSIIGPTETTDLLPTGAEQFHETAPISWMFHLYDPFSSTLCTAALRIVKDQKKDLYTIIAYFADPTVTPVAGKQASHTII